MRLFYLIFPLIFILHCGSVAAQSCVEDFNSSSKQKTTVIYFINGVNNEEDDALESLEHICSEYYDFLVSQHSDEGFEYRLSYNKHITLSRDLDEVFEQQALERLGMRPHQFIYLLKLSAGERERELQRKMQLFIASGPSIPPSVGGPPPDAMQDAATIQMRAHVLALSKKYKDHLLERINTVRAEDREVKEHAKFYLEDLSAGKRVVLIAHSQGNFFANRAMDLVLLENPDYIKNMGIISVAAPTGRLIGENRHITAHDDLIIRGLRAISINDVLDSNVDNELRLGIDLPYLDDIAHLAGEVSLLGGRDIVNHSFVNSYLDPVYENLASRLKLNVELNNILNRLESPEKEAESPIDNDNDGVLSNVDTDDSNPCLPSVSNNACRSLGDVSDVEPKRITVDQGRVFTVIGSRLPDTTVLRLGDSGTCDIRGARGTQVQRFYCDAVSTDKDSLTLVVDWSGGEELYRREIAVDRPDPEPVDSDNDGVLSDTDADDSDPCIPSVSNNACRLLGNVDDVEPKRVMVDEGREFTVMGSRLPDTTVLRLEGAGDCQIRGSRGTQTQRFYCSGVSTDKDSLTLAVGWFGGEELYRRQIIVDKPIPDPEPVPEAVVRNVSPDVATVGTLVDFVVSGENLPDTIAASLQGTSNCFISSKSATRVVVRCNPEEAGEKKLYIANKPGGDALRNTPWDIRVQNPTPIAPSVTSISPTSATVDSVTRFTISGINLKPANVVFFDGSVCSNEISTASDGSSIVVECTPVNTGSRVVTVRSERNGSVLSGPQLIVQVADAPYDDTPIIFNITPLEAKVGEEVEFRITSRDEPRLALSLEGGSCSSQNIPIEFIGSTNPEENRSITGIRCTPGESGTKSLIVSSDPIGIFIKNSNWDIDVQALTTSNQPLITGITPAAVRSGDVTMVTVQGENLPGDIMPDRFLSNNCTKISSNSTTMTIQCRFRPRITNQVLEFDVDAVSESDQEGMLIPRRDNVSLTVNPLASTVGDGYEVLYRNEFPYGPYVKFWVRLDRDIVDDLDNINATGEAYFHDDSNRGGVRCEITRTESRYIEGQCQANNTANLDMEIEVSAWYSGESVGRLSFIDATIECVNQAANVLDEPDIVCN